MINQKLLLGLSENNPKITSLTILITSVDNEFDDSSLSLTSITLSPQIALPEIQKFAIALQHNSTVQNLYISSNTYPRNRSGSTFEKSDVTTDQILQILLTSLITNTSIKTLRIESMTFNQESAKVLHEVIKNNRSIKKFASLENTLPHNDLNLAQAFASNTSIDTLRLKENTTEGMIAFAGVIENSQTLHTLDLKDCEASLEPILKSLCLTNAPIKKLILDNNGIGWETSGYNIFDADEVSDEDNSKTQENNIRMLSEFIAKTQTLIELSLNNNSMGQESIKMLTNALKQNRSLQKLSLCANAMLGECITELRKALCDNNSLLRLDISRNVINDTAKLELAKLVNECCFLTELMFSAQYLSQSESTVILLQAFKNNYTLTGSLEDSKSLKIELIKSYFDRNKELQMRMGLNGLAVAAWKNHYKSLLEMHRYFNDSNMPAEIRLLIVMFMTSLNAKDATDIYEKIEKLYLSIKDTQRLDVKSNTTNPEKTSEIKSYYGVYDDKKACVIKKRKLNDSQKECLVIPSTWWKQNKSSFLGNINSLNKPNEYDAISKPSCIELNINNNIMQ